MEKSTATEGKVTRRGFLNRLIGLAGGIFAVMFAYPLIKFIWPLQEKTWGEALALPLDSVPQNGYKITDYRSGKIIIVRTGKKVVALSAICTHMGCMVTYDKDGFILCPCHAGKFDLNGNVISGPPPRPLNEYPVRVVQNKIVVGG